MNHDSMLVVCVVCGVEHLRALGTTWHQDQCDDCITRWAYDKSVRDADKAITEGKPDEVVTEATRIRDLWRDAAARRGL